MLDLRAPRLAVLGSALLVALALAACGASNPNFCEGAGCDDLDATPDSAPQACTGSGADPACPPENPICVDRVCGGGCTADTDCAGRTDGHGVCLVPTGDCVACDESDAQAAPGSAEDECPTPAMAVCDAQTHTCRACEAHSECASGVCDAGTCVAAANVVYMKADGADAGECDTPGSGCLTMHYAKGRLTSTRKYILMAGGGATYDTRNDNNNVDFNGVGDSAHIIGYGATLNRVGVGATGSVLEVRGGAVVTIEGLTISAATGATGTGIICNSSELELRKATVQGNANLGIDASACTLRVLQSTIATNQGGGIQFGGGRFTIINNFIVANGGAMSAFGGVLLTSVLTTNAFEFNTVAANNSNSDLSPDGVTCNNAGLVARNNIITGARTKPRVNVGTTCSFTYTLVAPDGTLNGAGNMVVPDVGQFLFTSNSDFHIQAGSVAAGKAQSSNLAGETAVDADGDPRAVNGATVDVGADEIP